MSFARSSGLDRLLKCPASGVLPQSDERSDKAMAAADYGTAVHHWAATGRIEGADDVVKKVEKKLSKSGVTCLPWRSTRRPRDESFWCLEWTFALRFDPGRPVEVTVPTEEDRDHDAWKKAQDDNCLSGTADMVRLYTDENDDKSYTLHVDDLKTGRYPPAADCTQMLAYALAAFVFFDQQGKAAKISSVRLTITHWPYYPLGPDKDGLDIDRGFPTIHEKWVEPSVLLHLLNDIKIFKGEKERLSKKLTILQDDVRPGDHCTWCNAKNSCPA